MKKILVTGGAGYVGSTLVRTLINKGYNVKVLDNLRYDSHSVMVFWSDPNYEFIYGDIRNKEDVEKAISDVDAVVHLAALVGDPICDKEPEEATTTNLEGTKNVVNLAIKNKIKRFIYASTCSNYGVSDTSKAVDENFKLNPVSHYARTKVAAENYILGLNEPDFCYTIFRFGTAYGISGRKRDYLLINYFIEEAMEKGKITVYGGHFWRPWVHVNDMAQAIILVLEAPEEKIKCEIFNVVEKNLQKEQIVEMFKEKLGIEVEYFRKDEDKRDYRVSSEKIKRVLGFKPTKTVEEFIEKAADAYKAKVV